MRSTLARWAGAAAGATVLLTLAALLAAGPATSGDGVEALDPDSARSLAPSAGTIEVAQANPCNPCNPCQGKNPCNPCNPCKGKQNPCNPCGAMGKVDPKRFVKPEGAKLAVASHSELVAKGETLWNDRSLGKSGIACSTCHYQSYGQMNDTFDAPYPHFVAMPSQQAGVSQVSAAEMVNFCMIVPMQDEPLAWDSLELAALSAYVEKIQTGFEPGAGKALAGGNPCNPCGGVANPCNPCNPCGAKRNPCNPCGR